MLTDNDYNCNASAGNFSTFYSEDWRIEYTTRTDTHAHMHTHTHAHTHGFRHTCGHRHVHNTSVCTELYLLYNLGVSYFSDTQQSWQANELWCQWQEGNWSILKTHKHTHTCTARTPQCMPQSIVCIYCSLKDWIMVVAAAMIHVWLVDWLLQSEIVTCVLMYCIICACMLL